MSEKLKVKAAANHQFISDFPRIILSQTDF